MELGERIRLLREQEGLNQRDFSARIKIAQGTLAQFETGVRKPKDIHIIAICREFAIDENWLRTGNGDMRIESAESIIKDLIAEYRLDEIDQRLIFTNFCQTRPAERSNDN